jgi:NTE family protein
MEQQKGPILAKMLVVPPLTTDIWPGRLTCFAERAGGSDRARRRSLRPDPFRKVSRLPPILAASSPTGRDRLRPGGAVLPGQTEDQGLESRKLDLRAGWFLRTLSRRPEMGPAPLNLALQGGGAHGAFTWGVLDRLVEVEGLGYRAISGTSAGAVNAVVFASGWLSGGAPAAKTALAELWDAIAEAARPLRRSAVPHAALEATAQLFSPYQLNPLGSNPLRDLLARLVDFERIRRDRTLRLLIAATNLRTGALRLFENAELSPEAILASACLPSLHHAIEIEGEAYWDGGYVSNPPLLPLVERSEVRDLLLVRINTSARGDHPKSAAAIRSRVGEIVFEQPLERELALLEARRRTMPSLNRAQRRLARHRLHVIDGGSALAELDPNTRIIPDRDTLRHVRDLGRAAAADWLEGRGPTRRSPDRAA